MSLSINRKIFDRVKTAIAEAGRINMLSWAESRDSVTAESVDEIRGLPLLGDCRTTACIGGSVCHLATSQEIARAAEIYDSSDNEIQEPSLLGAALLLDDAEDRYELESDRLPLFSLPHWSPEEQIAYDASQTDAERMRSERSPPACAGIILQRRGFSDDRLERNGLSSHQRL
jgi:hypothetical protein